MRALVVLAAVLLAACGAGQRSDVDRSSTDAAVSVNDRLFITHVNGLAVVNVATGKVERELPTGLMSPDRKAYWAVERGKPTVVRKLDPQSGAELAAIVAPSGFDLPRAYGPIPDALSANGRYLVLTASEATLSHFAVLDLDRGKEHARATLNGRFTFDAIDDFGMSLYLHEHPQPNSTRYNVRLFDIGKNALAARPITDVKVSEPTAADIAQGTMGGTYHSSTTKGMWHFGLYTTATRGPVVHALHMVSRYASCLLDLTSVSTHRAGWAIVPDPKHDRVYAINAATGHFTTIAAQSLQMMHRTFAVQKGVDGDLRGSAVVSGDGSRIYATGGKGLLVIDGSTLSMKAQHLVDRELASVMVSPDGTRLYVLDRDGAISRIEPGTGRDLGVVARLPSALGIVSLDQR